MCSWIVCDALILSDVGRSPSKGSVEHAESGSFHLGVFPVAGVIHIIHVESYPKELAYFVAPPYPAGKVEWKY